MNRINIVTPDPLIEESFLEQIASAQQELKARDKILQEILPHYFRSSYIPYQSQEILHKEMQDLVKRREKITHTVVEILSRGTEDLSALNYRQFTPCSKVHDALVSYCREREIFLKYAIGETRIKSEEIDKEVFKKGAQVQSYIRQYVHDVENLHGRVQSEISLGFSEEEVKWLQKSLR